MNREMEYTIITLINSYLPVACATEAVKSKTSIHCDDLFVKGRHFFRGKRAKNGSGGGQ